MNQNLALTALRSLIFNLFFYSWMLLAASYGAFLGVTGQKQALARHAQHWSGGIAFLERTILGLTCTLRGKENLPNTPVIIAMQHQSAWETFRLFLWFDHPAVVLKQELLGVPFLGPCLKAYGCVPVARSKKADDLHSFLRGAEAMAKAGRPIVIFPQGTRTAPGAPSRFNKGVAILQGALKIPVVPVTLNSGKFWGRRTFLKYPGVIEVTFHPPIMPGLTREELLNTLRQYFQG